MSVPFLNTFKMYVVFHNLILAFHLDQGFCWAIHLGLWVSNPFSFPDNVDFGLIF
jgi:hypothetical protein